MLSRVSRIRLLLQVTRVLNEERPTEEVDVILRSYKLPDSKDPWGATLAQSLESASDDDLLEIAELLGIERPGDDAPKSTQTPTRVSNPLFVFASHISAQRSYVGEIGDRMRVYGIELFVAHDSIPDDAKWHDEIEQALRNANAGVVLLHPGIVESLWCGQEIGWMLGREIPVIAVNLGVTPFGPLGRQQAAPEKDPSAFAVSANIVGRLAKKPEVASSLATSLVDAIARSEHFADTDAIWTHLSTLSLDGNQCAGLLSAVKSNDQVYGANCRVGAPPYESYPRTIVKFLRSQPGAERVQHDLDEYERYLEQLERDARDWKARTARPLEPPF